MGQRSPLPPLFHLVLLPLLWGLCAGFRICAFKVQSFNSSKAANFRVMHTLTRVVSRCDICLLQEVWDPQGKATQALVSALNRYDEAHHYRSVASEGLGLTPTDKQQYVYLYRTGTVNVTAQYQYPDKNHAFSREPFVLRFQSNRTAVGEFALIPLQSAPTKAVQEMDQLYDVFQQVKGRLGTTNVMFLGDFNAGCGHMTRKRKKEIRLFTQPGFFWLIGDKVDTTVPDATSCPYDRIVVYGQPFLKNVKPYSAKVFNFGKAFKLPKMKQVLSVSDRFPVEVELRMRSSGQRTTPPLLLILSVIVCSGLTTPSLSL